jgi:cytochrome c
MKKFVFTGLALGAALFMGGAVHAGDAEAGKAKYATCIACHGAQGQGQAIFPKLAGHTAEEVVDLLTRYRAGEAVGANTPLMAPQAATLSDEDIANLAAYIETL